MVLVMTLSLEIIAKNLVYHAMSNMVLCNLNCNSLYVHTSVHIAADFGSLHHRVKMQYEYWEQKSVLYIGHIECSILGHLMHRHFLIIVREPCCSALNP